MKGNKFQQLIDKLIDARDLQANNFNGSYDSQQTNYSRHASELWEQLLNHISNGIYNSDEEKENHMGIRRNDFNSQQMSVVELISKNIDLDKDLFIEDKDRKEKPIDFFTLYTNSISKDDDKHWNESVAKLADYYYNLFYTNEKDSELIDGSKSNFSNLKNADAGFSFEEEPFVHPDKNGDRIGEEDATYEKIRGADKVLRVLKDMSHLQFTIDQELSKKDKEKINQYIRLLMPEYQREVQIEDLNRNFWVIGQALTALFSFLFDDTSVYPELLNAIFDEIVQLWENVFALWLCVNEISKPQKKEAKLLFLPVSDYKETDINTKAVLKNIWNSNFHYLKDKYDNCSLIIIPELREKNYANNYYSRVVYPGMIFYSDYSTDENEWEKFIPFECPIIIDLTDQKIYFDDENE